MNLPDVGFFCFTDWHKEKSPRTIWAQNYMSCCPVWGGRIQKELRSVEDDLINVLRSDIVTCKMLSGEEVDNQRGKAYWGRLHECIV